MTTDEEETLRYLTSEETIIRQLKRRWRRLADRYCGVATARMKPCSMRDCARAHTAMTSAYQAWQEAKESAEPLGIEGNP